MTTPAAGISTVLVTDAPQRVTDGTGASLLFTNTDENNEIWVSYQQAQAGSPVSVPVPPLGNVTMTDAKPMWAVCDPGNTASLLMLIGGTSFAPSAVQIATQILPLAVDIAEQIAATGLTLIGAPELIYNVLPGSAGTPGRFGLTMAGIYDNQADEDAQTTGWATNIGRPVTCSKWYGKPGQFPTTLADQKLQKMVDLGLYAYICFQPAYNPPTADDLTAMVASINAWKALGMKIGGVIFWQEHQLHLTAAQCIAVYQFYYAALHAVAPVCVDYAGSHIDEMDAYDPGAAYQDILLVDMYASTYQTGQLDHPVAVAKSYGKPWGLGELGNKAGAAPGPGNDKVISFMGDVTGLVNGSTQLDCFMWYQDNTNPAGPNYIDPGDPTDFRIPLLGTLNDAVLASGVTPTTIPHNSSLILTPSNPSTGAGYAIADRLSYDLFVNLTAGAGSTVPFAKVQMFWRNDDSHGASSIDVQSWLVPMGVSTSTGTLIRGKGPQAGQFLALQISNLDSVTCTVAAEVNKTSRQIPFHDWRWEAPSSVAIPGYTLPAGNGSLNSLGCVDMLSVPAGGTVKVLLSLFAGDVWVRLGTNASSAVITASLQPQPGSQWDNNGGWLLNELLSGTTATGPGDFTGKVTFPRAPMMVAFSNSDSVAHNVAASFIPLDH
jgi:hypothetical protein